MTLRLRAESGSMVTLSENATAARAVSIPDASGAVVLDTATQTLSNKTFSDSLLVEGTCEVGHGNAGSSTNTVLGREALRDATSVSSTTCIGYYAGRGITTGARNTAVGREALRYATTGGYNTAVGAFALQNVIDGADNVAVGQSAGWQITSGFNNVTVGENAGQNITSGANNICMGKAGGGAITTGDANIVIGGRTSSNSQSPVFSVTTEDDRIVMGSTAVTNAYIQVAWTVVSDARDKTDFAPVPHGLDFVCALKPTAYRYKPTREAVEGHGPVRYGFKAQEVLALEGNSPVIVDADDPEKLRFNDQALIAVLVNAVKELKAEVDDLRRQIDRSA
jgi:trimeric autotransporter adhesin